MHLALYCFKRECDDVISSPTLKWREVLDIDVGVVGSQGWHVHTIQHYGYHIVGENLPEFLSDVIIAESVLQGEVELVGGVHHLHAVPKTFQLAAGASVIVTSVNVNIYVTAITT